MPVRKRKNLAPLLFTALAIAAVGATAGLHYFGVVLDKSPDRTEVGEKKPGAVVADKSASIPNLAPPTISWVSMPEKGEQGRVKMAFKVQASAPIRSIKLVATPIVNQPGMTIGLDTKTIPSFYLGQKQLDWDGQIDLSGSLLAGAPVTLKIVAEDSDSRTAEGESAAITLPERLFMNPTAKTLYDLRKTVQQDPHKRLEALRALAIVLQQRGHFEGRDLTLLTLRSAAIRIALDKSEDGLRSALDLIWHAALLFEDYQPQVAVKS